jgi:hypothetical protein
VLVEQLLDDENDELMDKDVEPEAVVVLEESVA